MTTPTWHDTPLTRCATASLPLLIEAHTNLYGIAAPAASRLAGTIADLLESVIQIAGDVEAYGNKWSGGEMGELAEKIRAATKEWYDTGVA